MAKALPNAAFSLNHQTLNYKSVFNFAWQEFNAEPARYIAFTVLSVGLPLLLGSITFIAKFVGIIAFIGTPPLQIGTSAYYHHKIETRKKEFNFFFNPFYKLIQFCVFQFGAILAFIIICFPLNVWHDLLTSNGDEKIPLGELGWPIQIFSFITFLVILYGAMCVMFVPYFIYFFNMGIWPSLKNSYAIVKPRWPWFFGLFLFFAGLMACGFLCLIVGVLVAIPIIRLMSYFVFSQHVGLDEGKL